MPTNLLEASVQRPMWSQVFGCLVVVSLVFFVAVAVNLFIGIDELPRGLRGSTPWFAGVGVLLGLFTAWLYRRNRIALVVLEREGVRYLEVHDPARPIVIRAPMQLQYGYFTLDMPKARRQTTLVVGVYQEGELEVSFTETWGTIYGPPEGWAEAVPMKGIAKATYDCAGSSFLPELVRLLA